MADSLRVSIRLSAVTDIDLLVLAKTDRYFQRTTQQVLLAHLNGGTYPITLPNVEEVDGNGKTIFFRFSHPDIISWFDQIPKGRRSIIIKTLLKQSITNPLDSFMGVSTVKSAAPVVKKEPVRPPIVKKDKPTVPTMPSAASVPDIPIKKQETVPFIPPTKTKEKQDDEENVFDFI